MMQREHSAQGLRQHRHSPAGSDNDGEAELMRLQKELLSGTQKPAARTSRVTPSRPPAVPTAPPSPPKQAAADHAEPRQGLLPGMLGILTDVQEKQVSSHVSAPLPPTGGAAFPKATHRKQSKFALSRKHTPTGPADPSSTPANSMHTSEPRSSAVSAKGWTQAQDTVSSASSAHVTRAGKQSAAAASASQALPAAVAPAGAQQPTENPSMDVTAADQRRIDEENRQLLQSMSPAEVEEARQELLSRLTPEAQAFLAKRAAAKQTTKASTASAMATTAGPSSSTARPQQVVPDNDSHAIAGRQGATSRDATNSDQAMPQSAASSSAMPNHAEDIQTIAGPARRASRGGSGGAAVSEGSAGSKPKATSNPVTSSIRGVANGSTPSEGPESGLIPRLRYSLEGQLVGLKPPSSPSSGLEADQQVVQRDILRQSEGNSPEGYTLQEACILTRSSLTKQRVLALHLLSAVLSKARPQARHYDSQGVLQQQLVEFPSLFTQTEFVQGKASWAEVWEHALQEVQVATVLRMLMDDAQTSVVTAAAQALAVLVGPGRDEEEAWQAADDNPTTGCPMMPWRYLERPHCIGAWVCTPVEKPQSPAPPGPGLVEEQPQDDGRVATDPLIGLLSMQLLERISFLLRSPAAAAAASPLLLILQTYARAGADAARAVWQCPGMLKALQGLLQSTLPLAGDAMAVLRLLASSSSQMMKAVASSGLLSHAQRALAVATADSSHDVEKQLQHVSLQVEALHIWRVCANHNVNLMHLDDAFPSICRLFDWPPSSSSLTAQHAIAASRARTISGDGHMDEPHASTVQLSKAEQLLQKLQLRASCQAFLLLGSLVRHASREAERAMLSPGSASALVNAALEWLQPQVIQALTSSLLDLMADPKQGNGREDRAAAATAPGPLCSALAAVLQFLRAHVQARQVASDIATIKQTLLSCNILSMTTQTPNPSSSEGASSALLTTLQTQKLPSQAESATQQQPDQDHDLGSHPTTKPNQTHKSLVQAQTGPRHSEAELYSAVELQSCASELLYAIGLLSTTLSQHQLNEDACAGNPCMAVLEALSDQVLSRGAVPSGLAEIQPWRAMSMQHRLPQLRLLQYSLENAPVSQLSPDQSEHILQTALVLPTVLPPGAEAIALRALSTAFQTALLGPALAKACQVLHSFQAGGSSLARAAAGMTFEQMQSVHSTHSRQAASIAQDRPSQACVARASDPDARQQASRQRLDAAQSSASSAESERSRADQQLRQQDEQQGEEEEDQSGSGQLYPLEPLPDQAVCCQRLLQGYSAAWLGLVPTALTPTSAGLGVGPPLEVDVLLQPVGSRLPLPSGYPLMEITPPQVASLQDPNPPSSTLGQTLHPIPEEEEATGQTGYAAAAAEAAAQPDESAALSVGCALLMQLAVEEGMTAHPCDSASAGNKIKQVMEMVFNSEAAATAGSAEELWYHPLVRWSLAALLHRWYADQPDLSSVSPDDAQRWTEHFAALSYGDPLFSLALSPLLSRYSPLQVQVTVLQTLADERCLHLMPPMAMAVLPPTAYSIGNGEAAKQKQHHHHHQQQRHQADAKDRDQLQIVLQELQQGSLLGRCHASNSLVKDLKM